MKQTAIRRLAAFMIDYCVIASYIGNLIIINLFLLQTELDPPSDLSEKLAGHAQAFLLLTVPVWLYFTLQEHSSAQATLGKRVLRIRVENYPTFKPRFAQIAVRNGVRLLPWEISHAAIWYVPGTPFIDPMPTFNLAVCVATIVVASSYMVLLFFRDGRTPYDLAAGTWVVPAKLTN